MKLQSFLRRLIVDDMKTKHWRKRFPFENPGDVTADLRGLLEEDVEIVIRKIREMRGQQRHPNDGVLG